MELECKLIFDLDKIKLYEILKGKSTYFGNFKNGKYENLGFLTHLKGYHYKGKFKNGKKHGVGILTKDSDQIEQVCEFREDKFLGLYSTKAEGLKKELREYNLDQFLLEGNQKIKKIILNVK